MGSIIVLAQQHKSHSAIKPLITFALLTPFFSSYTQAGTGACSGSGSIIVNTFRTITCLPQNNDAVTITNAGTISTSAHALWNRGFTNVSITNNGTVSANASFYDIGLDNRGEITVFINNGVFNSLGTTWAQGTENYGTIQQFINNGNYTTTGQFAYLIYNAATIGAFENNGTMQSNASSFGIGLFNGGSVTSFTNNGAFINNGSAFGGYGIYNTGTMQTITNTDTLTGASDSVDGYGIFNIGTVNTLNNSGRITGQGENANAIGVVNTNLLNTINNSGDIIGHANNARGIGLQNSGQVALLGNLGNITGQGGTAGTGIENSGTITTLTNDGQISATSSAATDVAIINTGAINTLNNNANGVIRADNANETAIDSSSATARLDTLNHAGLIDGRINTKNTTINLSGSNVRITGSVQNPLTGAGSGNGAINLLSGTTFTTENTFLSDTFNVLNNSQLNIADNTHSITVQNAAANAFNHAGTISVGAGVTGNILGNYTQAGTLNIGLVSNINFGKLNINGTATINNGANYDVDVAAINSLSVGQVVPGVVTATNLNNLASTLPVTDNSALFNFIAQQNGNQIDLVTLQGISAVSAVQQHNIPAGMCHARLVDKLLDSGATGDMRTVLDHLIGLPDAASVANAVAQTLPLNTAAMNHATANTIRQTSQAINRRQAYISTVYDKQYQQFWMEVLGSKINQRTRQHVSGYKLRNKGVIFGAEKNGLLNNTTMGLTFSTLNSQVDGQSYASGHQANIDSYQLSHYGQYRLPNQTQPTTLNWQAGYSNHAVRGSRYIGFINRTARAKYRINAAYAELSLARKYKFKELSITPSVGLSYEKLWSQDYQEKKAGALNLNIKKQTSEALRLKFDINAAYPLTDYTTLIANLGIDFDTINQRNEVRTQFINQCGSCKTKGFKPDPIRLNLGLGITYQPNPDFKAALQFGLDRQHQQIGQTGMITIEWKF